MSDSSLFTNTATSGDMSPQRSTIPTNDAYYTYTPCTRLSRMTIESQSANSGRIRPTFIQRPVTNFQQKLLEVVREEGVHPNLNMFLGEDKISIFDRKNSTRRVSFSDDDEESDGGDLFSSSLYPASSPDNVVTRRSIFDDDVMDSSPVRPRALIFDSMLNDDENEDDVDRYYDSTLSWISNIYVGDDHDNNKAQYDDSHSNNNSNNIINNQENTPPRGYQSKQYTVNFKYESTNSAQLDGMKERFPLKEIKCDDYLSDEEVHINKKAALGHGKSRKIRVMRTLSPPRWSQRKVKESNENDTMLS